MFRFYCYFYLFSFVTNERASSCYLTHHFPARFNIIHRSTVEVRETTNMGLKGLVFCFFSGLLRVTNITVNSFYIQVLVLHVSHVFSFTDIAT